VTEGGAENGEGAAARDAGWSVESGRVPERLGQLAADRASGFAGHEAYVCGSPGFVDAVRGMLLQCGLPVQDCFADAFVSAAPAARA
jgi:ferredoxin-NADP reductase